MDNDKTEKVEDTKMSEMTEDIHLDNDQSPVGDGFGRLASLLEAAIFVSEEPMKISQMKSLTSENKRTIDKALECLKESYNSAQRGIRLIETAGGYRFETDPVFGPELKGYFGSKDSGKLSRAAMETLAIITYKQPVTVPEINEIRSVDSAGVIGKLLTKKIVKILGRKEVIGRPLLYGTTRQFLAKFGLNSIDDLPAFDEFIEIMGADTDKTALEQEFGEHLKPDREAEVTPDQSE